MYHIGTISTITSITQQTEWKNTYIVRFFTWQSRYDQQWMQLADFLLLQLAMFLFLMNPCSVLNKITLLLMQYATSFLVPLKCIRRYRNLHGDCGGPIAHHFFALYSKKYVRAYNPVTPDISFWLVRTKTTVLKIVTLLAKSTPDLFKFTWIRPGPFNTSSTDWCTEESYS